MRAELKVLLYLVVFCLVSAHDYVLSRLISQEPSVANRLADKLVALRQDSVCEKSLHLPSERGVCEETASSVARVRLYVELFGELLLSFYRTSGYIVKLVKRDSLVFR